MLSTLTLTHSAWPSTLALVRDAVDQALVIEDDSTVMFVADPVLTVPTMSKDDGGRVSSAIQIGNDGGALDALFNALRGSSERPAVTLRWFDDDETLVIGPVYLQLHEPVASGAAISAQVRSRNDEDLPAQVRVFTVANTPSLRGLR